MQPSSERLWRRAPNNVGRLSLAIIHHPVLDKQGDIVSTSINNLEIHDVARSCMTFGVEMCYIVTPLEKQRTIAELLINHWKFGYGRKYNEDRAVALTKICMRSSVAEVMAEFQQGLPIVVGTSSKQRSSSIEFGDMKTWIAADPRPFLLLFGTGWGLPAEITESCERMLVPIRGEGDYNHLSLRVAIGIILDRLFGKRGGEQ
jgi:hypothetical protein